MSANKQAKNPYLLPATVKPEHYAITLTPNQKIFEAGYVEKAEKDAELLARSQGKPETKIKTAKAKALNKIFTFTGEECIDIQIKRKTSTITLHALDLKITYASIYYGGWPDDFPAKKITFNKKMQTVTLDFGKPALALGEAKLFLNFEGTLNDQMCGFYRTSYTINGEKHWGAATQFEATDARRAFPCWDEPSQKATFSINLVVPKGLTALSNMHSVEESVIAETPDKKLVKFATSIKMSTYLVAFVIADLEYIEAYDKNNVRIRVYTTPGKKEHGRFALDVALFTVPFLADYYKMPYPLKKLDFVALPDFGAGAMENMGLETFRETALLVDPANMSIAALERIADVVTHELAHNVGFGNIVTMLWWTHLWLNEGFANFVECKVVDRKFPKWERVLRFVAEDVRGALHAMDKKNSHAIEIDVRNPAEIREIFDTTTYSGGGSVNLMNEQYLTEKGFRKGLRAYMKKYAYGNATTQNLWEMLEKATGKPVRSVMGTYTRQAGYPLVIVKEKESAHRYSRVFELEQKRFIFDGASDRKNPTWTIPISAITPSYQSPYHYMKSKNTTVTVNAWAHDWVKFNPGTSALYRVLYPEHMRRNLAQAVKNGDSRITPADRIGLLDDAFALARAGYLKTTEALDLLDSYKNEENCYVWTVIASAFNAMDNLIGPESAAQVIFKKYARNFFEPMTLHMGWEKRDGERNSDILLRSLLLRNYGGYGHMGIVTQAFLKFDKHTTVKPIDPDIRHVVYSLIAENGGNGELEKLIKVYEGTDDHQEKIRILRAVGMTKNQETIKQVLAFAVSDKVRKQDTPIIILSTGSNNTAQPLVWEFLKSNWKMFVERYHGGGLGLLSRMVGVAGGFTTEEAYRDVKEFFAKNKLAGAKRVMAETLEQIQSNAAWVKRDKENVTNWFNTKGAGEAQKTSSTA